MVRRKFWPKGVFMRICNRDKVSDGIKKGYDCPVYFHTTQGYFYHLGIGSLMTKNPEGNGLQHDYFSEDWEDYGYISPDDFEMKTLKYKKQK